MKDKYNIALLLQCYIARSHLSYPNENKEKWKIFSYIDQENLPKTKLLNKQTIGPCFNLLSRNCYYYEKCRTFT